MLDVYAFATPNSIKVPIALEELGLDYALHPVNVRKGEQRAPDFTALNPNGKVPVLVDPDGADGRLVLTESAAILVYLAEKSGQLLPAAGTGRARVFEQIFFHASALGPAFGQSGFFQRQAAEPQPIAIQRFSTEAKRTLAVLDSGLATRRFVAGDAFTIADIAHFGWLWRREFAGIDFEDSPHVARWYAEIEARPAVQRAIERVNALIPKPEPDPQETVMSKLFTPVRAGALSLGHRVVMAPLTRMRADPGDRPSALMEEYYSQRASGGGLIISEATPISRQGYGYAGAPGIYDDAQIDGWRAITDAVHAKGGQIVLQLWHVGRQSHPDIQPGSGAPVAPSAIQAEGYGYSADREIAFSMPRALERDEITGIIADFGAGAARARAAGFDGVEIHGANGYLPDQFLQDGTNKRTDDYGGSIENRARFLIEVTQAAIDVWGADRVGVRLSPSGTYGSMSDSDPQATFAYAASRLDDLGIAWLHVVEPRIKGTELIADVEPVAARHLRSAFRGTLIAAGGFDRAGAEAIIGSGNADAVAFGRAFIANPDLPERLRLGLPLNPYDRATFYGGDARGYTDYPSYRRAARPSVTHSDGE